MSEKPVKPANPPVVKNETPTVKPNPPSMPGKTATTNKVQDSIDRRKTKK